ncbi:MAG: NusG domain II-containing protein [Lachnospiraceae bacterium]|nr:NusG domain II-containing protein [Lachnospiraceae bacterium]
MIKFSKRDVIYLSCLLMIGIIFTIGIFAFSKKGNTLVIYVDGEIYGEYSLNSDETIEINDEFGNNTVIIKDGEAYMVDADCPDGLCMKQGKISKAGQNIVCLPHRLVLEVKGDEKGEFDAISS